MPALSNGNTCWGNRKSFNMNGEYISDSFLFDLCEVREDPNNTRQNFISSNQYYGYHRIPEPPIQEEMSVDECPESIDNGTAACRKRPSSSEQDFEMVKRIRQEPQEDMAPIYQDSRTMMFDSNYCLL